MKVSDGWTERSQFNPCFNFYDWRYSSFILTRWHFWKFQVGMATSSKKIKTSRIVTTCACTMTIRTCAPTAKRSRCIYAGTGIRVKEVRRPSVLQSGENSIRVLMIEPFTIFQCARDNASSRTELAHTRPGVATSSASAAARDPMCRIA